MAEPAKKDETLALAVRDAFQKHMEQARQAAIASRGVKPLPPGLGEPQKPVRTALLQPPTPANSQPATPAPAPEPRAIERRPAPAPVTPQAPVAKPAPEPVARAVAPEPRPQAQPQLRAAPLLGDPLPPVATRETSPSREPAEPASGAAALPRLRPAPDLRNMRSAPTAIEPAPGGQGPTEAKRALVEPRMPIAPRRPAPPRAEPVEQRLPAPRREPAAPASDEFDALRDIFADEARLPDATTERIRLSSARLPSVNGDWHSEPQARQEPASRVVPAEWQEPTRSLTVAPERIAPASRAVAADTPVGRFGAARTRNTSLQPATREPASRRVDRDRRDPGAIGGLLAAPGVAFKRLSDAAMSRNGLLAVGGGAIVLCVVIAGTLLLREPAGLPVSGAAEPSAAAAKPAEVATRPVKTLKITLDQVDIAVQEARERAQIGDVARARLMLAALQSTGDARVLFAMGETFDPALVRDPASADPQQALRFYESAQQAGHNGAAERVARLAVKAN